jgi:hypothetical protein
MCNLPPTLRATPNVSTSMRTKVKCSAAAVKRGGVKRRVVHNSQSLGFLLRTAGERGGHPPLKSGATDGVDRPRLRVKTHRRARGDDSFGAAPGLLAIAMQRQVCAISGHCPTVSRTGERPSRGHEMTWPRPPERGRFILMMRCYWPDENDLPILDDSSGDAGWLKQQIADNLMLAGWMGNIASRIECACVVQHAVRGKHEGAGHSPVAGCGPGRRRHQ